MSRKIATLIDLSGTLHIEDSVIPGAVEALCKLRRVPNCKILFVTNTTKQCSRLLFDRLVRLGFQIDKSEIFSSLSATKQLLLERNLDPMLILEDNVLEDFVEFKNSDGKNKPAVVVGLAPTKFDYKTMNTAFNKILNDKAELIAIHKGRYYQNDQGLQLGPGPYVEALEFATGCRAEVIGKPEKAFFNAALRKLDAIDCETFMIGDDVRDDIDGAQKVGIKGILVKTGKYRSDDQLKINPKPWNFANDFPHAVQIILDHLHITL